MVKTTAELLELLKQRIGDDTSDESLSFIEDVNDTMNDLTNKASKANEYEQKYKDNDAAWRQKYRDRFFKTESDETDYNDSDIGQPTTIRNFDDLFKEG